jgi:hypothetical protein
VPQRVVGHGERLDKCTVGVGEFIGDAMKPLSPDHEGLCRSAVDVETEVIPAARTDDAFTHDPISGGETLNAISDFNDLPAPFMPGRNGVLKGDDVLAGEELEVRVADAHGTRRDDHFSGAW